MTLATITETLALPADGSSATLGQTRARLRLVAAVGGVATAYTTGLTAVVADAWETVATDGTYSFTGVRPNSGSSGDVITTPTGTVYELTVVYPDRSHLVRYLDVPDSAGPHAPATIETADPVHVDRWSTAHLSDVSDTAATSGQVLVSDGTTWTPGVAPAPGYVKVFDTDGALPSGWLDAQDLSGQTSWWDSIEVLSGDLVIPTPDTGAIAGTTNSGARAVAYKDFSAYTWAADNISVSITWTGEEPYEASPLLHIDTSAAGFGIGCWPIYDVIPGGAAQSVWALGVVGRRPDQVSLWTLVSFTHPLGTPKRLELRSISGAITFLVDGVTVIDSYDVPTAYEGLLTSKVHGIAIDNNQSDGNSGAGGARPANKGAARGPFMLVPCVQLPSAPVPGTDALLALKADRSVETDLAAHLADTADAHDASAISYVGGTGMSATDVEAAVDELATEKANLTGGTFTGAVVVNDGTGGSTTVGHSSGTPLIGLRAVAGDTNPVVAVGTLFGAGGVSAGPGGGSAIDSYWVRSDAGIWNAIEGGIAGVGKGVTFTEQTDPSAPAANGATLYCRDNGSGKTQLCVRFPTGAVQVIATEP